MFYRVKQFFKAMTASVSSDEYTWVKGYLSDAELELFLRLKIYEQRHCIDVARILEELANKDSEMIRLGLLHDVGKSVYPLNPFEKSIMVVCDKISKGSIKKLHGLKMVKCYYNHPLLGYTLLKQTGGYEEGFLEIIKLHHFQGNDPRLVLLQEADNKA